jgi:hypothetical protein
MITPADDQFHRRSDDVLWNESCWIGIAVPEAKLGGICYFYHRPNMNLSAGGWSFWDGNGEEIYDCAHWDWHTTLPLPEGADMFDFSLDNTLSVRPIELGYKYHLAYNRNGCEVDVVWEALNDPVEIHRGGAGGAIDQQAADWVVDRGDGLPIGHYEQPGWATGTVRVRGETFSVNAASCRDHSWGPRDLRNIPRGSWPWAVANEKSSFLMWGGVPLPADRDPGTNTEVRTGSGFYIRDGVAAQLVSGTERVLEYGDDGRPLHEVIDAVDSLGRELHAEGEAVSLLKWTGYNDVFDWWTLAKWQFDGHSCWGEMHHWYQFGPHGPSMRRTLEEMRERGELTAAGSDPTRSPMLTGR